MSYQCALCSTVRSSAEQTIIPDLFLAHCRTCDRKTPHHEVEPAPADVAPVARATDPGTSWEAAKSVKKVRTTQLRILAALRAMGPMTDEEIAAALAKHHWAVSPSGARTRRAELVDMGLVADSGQRRRLSTGRRGIVWAAVERGSVAA